MNILAIDTSSKILSLAVAKKGAIVSSKNVTLAKVLSAKIIPNIEGVVKKAKLKLPDIDGFAIGLGPGSFTSLRVGLSTVKGLALALKKPVVGAASLDVIAMNVEEKGAPLCVILDARRGLVYAGVYRLDGNKLKNLTGHLLTDVDSLLKRVESPAVFLGDGINAYREKIIASGKLLRFEEEKKWYPRAEKLISLALDKFKRNKYDNIDKLVPVYLYAHDCQVHK